ncbi:hypothetical protein AGMMS49546_24540 [Spirochaetia bacterium]|nr:hypothetical protein AGMMS49546_24540 [Spirochaetia bacterium]
MYTKIMPLEDELDITVKSIELRKQGKTEEAEKLIKQVPLSPWLAQWAKKRMGADFLVKYGWNLAGAEAEYGPGWLSK